MEKLSKGMVELNGGEVYIREGPMHVKDLECPDGG